MNKQEIFDKVVKHLGKQREQSLLSNSSTCAYRGERGLMCAAGCLIPDELYYSELEGEAFECLYSLHEALGLGGEEVDLVQALQSVHDESEPRNWAEALKMVAKERGLKYGQIRKFFK